MTHKKIIVFVSSAVLFTLVNWFCSKSANTSSYGNTPPVVNSNAVRIYNMAFSPSSLTVKTGTKVTWTNTDGYAHTVTSDDGTTFSSGNVAGGTTFSFTPAVAGTYKYHCNIHSGMTGTLVVTQ
jgi:plastocyanin